MNLALSDQTSGLRPETMGLSEGQRQLFLRVHGALSLYPTKRLRVTWSDKSQPLSSSQRGPGLSPAYSGAALGRGEKAAELGPWRRGVGRADCPVGTCFGSLRLQRLLLGPYPWSLQNWQ